MFSLTSTVAIHRCQLPTLCTARSRSRGMACWTTPWLPVCPVAWLFDLDRSRSCLAIMSCDVYICTILYAYVMWVFACVPVLLSAWPSFRLATTPGHYAWPLHLPLCIPLWHPLPLCRRSELRWGRWDWLRLAKNVGRGAFPKAWHQTPNGHRISISRGEDVVVPNRE